MTAAPVRPTLAPICMRSTTPASMLRGPSLSTSRQVLPDALSSACGKAGMSAELDLCSADFSSRQTSDRCVCSTCCLDRLLVHAAQQLHRATAADSHGQALLLQGCSSRTSSSQRKRRRQVQRLLGRPSSCLGVPRPTSSSSSTCSRRLQPGARRPPAGTLHLAITHLHPWCAYLTRLLRCLASKGREMQRLATQRTFHTISCTTDIWPPRLSRELHAARPHCS